MVALTHWAAMCGDRHYTRSTQTALIAWIKSLGYIAHSSSCSVQSTCSHHAADDFAEDDVLGVEPARFGEQDVELWAVGVLAVVGHRHPARRAVTQDEVLVVEPVAEDALTWCGMSWDEHTCVQSMAGHKHNWRVDTSHYNVHWHYNVQSCVCTQHKISTLAPTRQ